jgi:predicted Zn finger-like uncharacterized protein
MKIACPSCKTFYQIDPAVIGGQGRSARCSRCQHVWFVSRLSAVPTSGSAAPSERTDSDDAVKAFSAELGATPERQPPESAGKDPQTIAAPSWSPDDPATTGEADQAPGPVALSDIAIAVDDAPSVVPAPGEGRPELLNPDDTTPGDVESVAARRASAASRRRRRALVWPLLILVMGAATAAVLGLRKDIVRHAPQLASFYSAIGLPVNLRGVGFTDLKIGNEIHDGVPVLVVEGVIVSVTSTPVDLPRLRFSLRNASGAELYAWTAQPSQPVLGPFETLPFRTRLAAPPAEGHDVQVRFLTSHDVTAGR